jgi:eukaryotic-like serine/threonine-protein kinase
MNATGQSSRARTSAFVHPPSFQPSTSAASRLDCWRLTRRLPSSGRLSLFRAAAASDRGPGCYVLKTSSHSRPHDEVSHALLAREAAVAAAVSHCSLVSIVAADLEGSFSLVVLPYYEGVTLRQLLHSLGGASRRISVCHALSIARQIAAALAALHDAGWLHGQLRPEHVMIAPQGHATLLDLTQSRRLAHRECDGDDTFPRAPCYAAPETFSSRRLTAAADTYSLGVTLFEALTGRPPFSASSPQELAGCHRQQAPPDIRDLRSDISIDVAHLLRHMLAKEPLRRPSDSQLIRWQAELEIEALRGAGILACR